jgi:hypothetical protein
MSGTFGSISYNNTTLRTKITIETSNNASVPITNGNLIITGNAFTRNLPIVTEKLLLQSITEIIHSDGKSNTTIYTNGGYTCDNGYHYYLG